MFHGGRAAVCVSHWMPEPSRRLVCVFALRNYQPTKRWKAPFCHLLVLDCASAQCFPIRVPDCCHHFRILKKKIIGALKKIQQILTKFLSSTHWFQVAPILPIDHYHLVPIGWRWWKISTRNHSPITFQGNGSISSVQETPKGQSIRHHQTFPCRRRDSANPIPTGLLFNSTLT